MNRLPVRRTAALLLAGFGLTAHADPVPLAAQRQPIKPAVQLLGVREVTAPTETVRGAPAPTIQPFDPFFDPSAVPVSRPGISGIMRTNEGPPPANMYPPAGPIDPRERIQQQAANPRGIFGMMGDWTSERARAIKTAFAGPPQPMPVPQVGQFAQPMPTAPMPMGQYGQPMTMAVPNQPIRGVTPGGRMAYAGNPAYRWYGWGTTTPGANPYAPSGEYPAGSSQWYAMSGATPGAFPTPVTNPFRPPPGPEAPAYAARTATLPHPIATVPAPAVVFDPPAYGPAPIAETAPFRYLPPDELPAGAVIVPGVPPPGPLSAKPKAEPPAGADTVWQPVAYTTPAPPPAPLVGQTSPTTREIAWQPPTAAVPMTLQERVQAVCGTGVSNLEVKQLGRDAVIVRFNAPSDAVAGQVAKTISEIAELKPFTVTFDVVVNGR